MSLKNIAEGIYDFGKGMYKRGSKITEKLIEPTSFKQGENIWQKLTGVRLTDTGKKVFAVGSAAFTTFGVVDAVNDAEHIGKTGTMVGEELANTVNSVRSPNLSVAVSKMDKNMDKYAKENFNNSQSGVDANLVFALHELRNG